MLEALDANGEGGENRLNKSELFTIYYPNLLVPPERWDQDFIVSGKASILESRCSWRLFGNSYVANYNIFDDVGSQLKPQAYLYDHRCMITNNLRPLKPSRLFS